MFNFITKKFNKKNNSVPIQHNRSQAPTLTNAQYTTTPSAPIIVAEVVTLQTPSAPFIENIEVLEIRNKMSQMDFLYKKEKNKILNNYDLKRHVINDNNFSTNLFNNFDDTNDNKNLFSLTMGANWGKKFVFPNTSDIISGPFLLFYVTCNSIEHKFQMNNLKPSDIFEEVDYEIGGNLMNRFDKTNINILTKMYNRV